MLLTTSLILGCPSPAPDAGISVTGITLNVSDMTLSIGESEQLAATVSPSNATDTSVHWESSDPGKATVADGLVSGVADGTAVITARTADGGFTATCTVFVVDPAKDAHLGALEFASGSLAPDFTPSIFTYALSVGSGTAELSLTATGSVPGVTISLKCNGSGWTGLTSGDPSDPIALNEGTNAVELVVTALDAVTTCTYSIAVYRSYESPLLSGLNLSVGTLNPAFDPQVAAYAANASNAAASTTVTASPTKAASTMQVRVDGGSWQPLGSGTPSAALSLDVGDNSIEVLVTAGDGVTTRTYAVVVHRASTNADLSSMMFNKGALAPAFDPAVTSYTTAIDNGAPYWFGVKATVAYPLSTITVQLNGGEWRSAVSGTYLGFGDLNFGNNTVLVRVTPEEGSERTYTTIVYRKSASTYLTSLGVSPGSLKPAFDPDVWVDTFTSTIINSAESITITAETFETTPAMQLQVNGGAWQTIESGVPSPPLGMNRGLNLVEFRVISEDGLFVATRHLKVLRRYPGAIDLDFPDGSGPNGVVRAIALQSDGKILIGGDFQSVSTVLRRGIARLDSSGVLDPSMNATRSDITSTMNQMEVQSDGKLFVAGNFYPYDGTSVRRLARLNWDGSLNPSFSSGSGASGVFSVHLLDSGQIIIAGGFIDYNGVNRRGIARLNSDGALDSTFPACSALTNDIHATAVQSDGKIVIGGWFTTDGWATYSALKRLNSDGSLDTTFSVTPAMLSHYVYAVAVQADGKILIGGTFTSFDGTARKYLARLNEDGSLDTTFSATGDGLDGAVNVIVVQDDGKILIGGSFTAYDGIGRKGIARLNSDGSLDISFMQAGDGATGLVRKIVVQGNGQILVGGDFISFDGVNRKYLARLWGE